jgi:hypothetical protein
MIMDVHRLLRKHIVPSSSLQLVLLLLVGCCSNSFIGPLQVESWKFSPLQEKLALIEFKQLASTTNSSDWDNLWDYHSTDQCSGRWSGVRCNNAGYITHLYLGRKNVNGRLFDKFFYFRDLEELWLGENNITNNLPASIGSLNKLRLLDLSNNHFVGSIPPSWGSLSHIQHLNLRMNPELTGSLPDALSSLSDIRFTFEGTQLENAFHAVGGSTGNNGRQPYTASRTNGAASTYPHQRRRLHSNIESFRHINL